MSPATLSQVRKRATNFRHEALLYAGQDEFVALVSTFVQDAAAAGEPLLVVVSGEKIDLLRSSLNGETDGVIFADMGEVGQNPARIIPVWREFVNEYAADGRGVRGIGEPVWPGRGEAELAECRQHEALLNVAFADTPGWWLLCPYDTSALDPMVIDQALRTHPFIQQGRARTETSESFRVQMATALSEEPLPPPADQALDFVFEFGDLPAVRALVSQHARKAGIGGMKAMDLVLAVNELATNSLRHGGGRGTLHIWRQGDALICEVRDSGRIDRPLVGREHPTMDGYGGRGLWLVNQLCDLVQLRSSDAGTIVRVHMRSGEGERSEPVGGDQED